MNQPHKQHHRLTFTTNAPRSPLCQIGWLFLLSAIGCLHVGAQDAAAANAKVSAVPVAPGISVEGKQKPMDLDEPQVMVAPMGLAAAAKQKPIVLSALPTPLIDQLKSEDAGAKGRLRVGIIRDLDQPLAVAGAKASAGQWNALPDGSHVWSMQIEAQDALALRVHLESVRLPQGVQLLVYDAVKPPAAVAPMTSENLPAKTDVWLPTVFSDKMIIECQAGPGVSVETVAFTLKQVSHVYRAFWSDPEAKVGSCHNDVSCYSIWAGQAAGVALMHFNDQYYSYICTGSLLSDRDSTSYIDYFLAANHCISDAPTAATLECFWFYQSRYCNGPVPDLSTVPQTSGADFLAGASTADFTLLRLRQPSPRGVYYLGWSTSAPSLSEQLACIHHPDDTYKRISFGRLNTSDPYFYTVQWTSGVTEPGSSGAPLFNSSHQVIGQLYGGPSSCDNQSGTDDYGRFNVTYATISPWIDAAPIPNDYCTGAIPLTDNVYYSQNTSRAANDYVPSLRICYAGVWFSWTAPFDGGATVDTCGSDFDTMVEVLSGACSSLVSLGSDDDTTACGPSASGLQSSFSWRCTAGTTYRICAGGYGGASGNLKIRVHGIQGRPASFAMTSSPTLNGTVADTINLAPGTTLSGDLQYLVRNHQVLPGNIITVIGLVNSAGQSVGGLPQVIYDGSPSIAGDVGDASWANLAVPMAGGTYRLRFKAYMSIDPTGCVNDFSAHPPISDSGSMQGLVASVIVPATYPWTLYWQQNSGGTALWQMDGTNACSFQQWRLNAAPASPGWNVVGVGDFTGTGSGDLLWQHTDGSVALWLLDGTNIVSRLRIGNGPASAGWRIGATGDLVGDGQTDILWQHTSGSTAVWFMNRTNWTRTARLNTPLASLGWRMAGAGDFDHDGHLDILWQHTDGSTAVWFMNGTNFVRAARLNVPPIDAGWQIVGTVDLYGSGYPDLLWQHDNGSLAYWRMNGVTRVGVGRLNPSQIDTSWRIVGPQ